MNPLQFGAKTIKFENRYYPGQTCDSFLSEQLAANIKKRGIPCFKLPDNRFLLLNHQEHVKLKRELSKSSATDFDEIIKQFKDQAWKKTESVVQFIYVRKPHAPGRLIHRIVTDLKKLLES